MSRGQEIPTAPEPPTSSGHVDVGELELYYERRGRGVPLILLHGAMGTIESCFDQLLTPLSEHFDVVAVELQGHGRTRDIDRPLSYEGMAGDLPPLLDALGIERAHVAGYSMGGAVALQLALDRPDLVERAVFFGGPAFDTGGVHPELASGFEDFDPHQLDGTPWHEAYVRVAADPDGWIPLVRKVNELDRLGQMWSKERLAGVQVPVLLVAGDADVVRLEHVVEMFRALGGGGVAGDVVDLPPSRLAVLPGTSHVGVLDRTDWLVSLLVDFLTSRRPT